LEIELRAQVEDAKALRERVAAMAQKQGEYKDFDKYMSADEALVVKGRSALKRVLRIRRRTGSASLTELTYKGLTSKHGVWVEYSIPLQEPDRMETILRLSGFRNIANIHKKREAYSYEGYEICIDDVSGLGKFVEVQRIADKNIDEEREELHKFLSRLGLLEADWRSYLEILLESKGKQ
jgi:adenylate cyclase class 2